MTVACWKGCLNAVDVLLALGAEPEIEDWVRGGGGCGGDCVPAALTEPSCSAAAPRSCTRHAKGTLTWWTCCSSTGSTWTSQTWWVATHPPLLLIYMLIWRRRAGGAR